MREKWLQKLGMDKSQAYVTVNIPLTAGNDTNMSLLGCCQSYLEDAARLVTSKLHWDSFNFSVLFANIPAAEFVHMRVCCICVIRLIMMFDLSLHVVIFKQI